VCFKYRENKTLLNVLVSKIHNTFPQFEKITN
jgi:hypothetical protein